jgi:hypothetical protein
MSEINTIDPTLYKENPAINGTTKYILDNIPGMKLVRCPNINFHRFVFPTEDGSDPTGINVEEGELLYGLVRVFKPRLMLETGTNIGVSAMYAALAMKDNGFGKLLTIEGFKDLIPVAQKYFDMVGVTEQVEIVHAMTEDFELNKDQDIDFMWLDTKIETRYPEMEKFYPKLTNGGIICVHDHPRLGENPMFGEVPNIARSMHRIEIQSGCGMTFFQKRVPGLASENRVYYGINNK